MLFYLAVYFLKIRFEQALGYKDLQIPSLFSSIQFSRICRVNHVGAIAATKLRCNFCYAKFVAVRFIVY